MSLPPPVRSFGISELLSDTWRITRRVFVPSLPLLLVLVLQQVWYLNETLAVPGEFPWQAFLVVSLLGITVGPILYGALLQLALDGDGGRPELSAALRAGVARFFPLLGAYLVLGTIIALGTVACVIPGVFLALAFAPVLPMVMTGEAGPLSALGVSWERMRGHRIDLLVASLAVGACGLLVAMSGACLIGGVLSVIKVASGGQFDPQHVGQLIGGLYGAIASVLVVPWMALLASLHHRLLAPPNPPAPAEAPIAPAAPWTAPPSP